MLQSMQRLARRTVCISSSFRASSIILNNCQLMQRLQVLPAKFYRPIPHLQAGTGWNLTKILPGIAVKPRELSYWKYTSKVFSRCSGGKPFNSCFSLPASKNFCSLDDITKLKMNLSDNEQFLNLLTPELHKLVKAFTEHGHETRLVGGAVRDIILSRHLPKDIDLATTATPDEMINIFKTNKIRYIETGLQHGTLTAHLNGHDFEITTLRIDSEHDGRRAVVEFTNDWKVDAERRDLTFNAMSLDFNGNLYDYFDGCDDLKHKKVKFVGDPEKRIKEDFLRILRYFRFHGRISDHANDHDEKTLGVIRKCAYGLKNVAVERVWAEVSRILTANHAPSLLKYMYQLGVAENIGLPPCTEKHLQEFESVWSQGCTHKLEPVTILMSLVDTVTEAENLALMLKLSSAERNLGKFIVTHRSIPCSEDPKKPYKDMLTACCNLKLFDKIKQHVDQLLRYRGFHDLADELERWPVPAFPVSGNDIKKLGIKPGPALGKILHELREMWMDSYYTLSQEELLEKVDHIHANMHS